MTLEIPGKPFAKQRPRFSRRTGRAFTPAQTISFESTVATIAAQKIRSPMEGPVRITIRATFAPAASWSKKKTEAHINRPHIQRPDLDNIAKAICDGLNRIAFADDSQIAEMVVSKVWGPVARTIVHIECIGG